MPLRTSHSRSRQKHNVFRSFSCLHFQCFCRGYPQQQNFGHFWSGHQHHIACSSNCSLKFLGGDSGPLLPTFRYHDILQPNLCFRNIDGRLKLASEMQNNDSRYIQYRRTNQRGLIFHLPQLLVHSDHILLYTQSSPPSLFHLLLQR